MTYRSKRGDEEGDVSKENLKIEEQLKEEGRSNA